MPGTFKEKTYRFFGWDQFWPDDTVPNYPDTEPYVDEEPSIVDFFNEHRPTWRSVFLYIYRLFPFLDWMPKYNWTWFAGDLIAGTTVGAVVVPQGMAYANLALLPVQYGLYSSFMGVLIYWFFATSKDITIGPVAVMSLVTGNVVARARETIDVDPAIVASAFALITGAIITFLGLARLGWIVELIPLPAIAAFMTGGGFSVAVGQVSKILGIKGINTRTAAYLVVINTLKALPSATIDAAMGMTALLMLYMIRSFCSYMSKKQPHRAKVYFFISTLRTAFVILLYTAISAGVNLHRRENPRFSILQDVPRGFQHAAVPTINREIILAFANEIPAGVIVMLIEHISISKSFGRINNYTIDPSQELVAIGVTNLLGPFLGGYPATGSFSRTAIKSKAGVRTPFAGVITAIVVLLALYALTAVFYYIPDAALGAVIFHAVCDVITPPRVVWQFWRVAPLDFVIYIAGVLVTIFSSIENGIYTSVSVSFAIVIWRLFLSKGRVLGQARVRTVRSSAAGSSEPGSDSDNKGGASATKVEAVPSSTRTTYLPIDHKDGSNPSVQLEQPHPGVFIYQFAEGFNYPNASSYLTDLTETIFKQTKRTDPSRLGKLGDRPWNDGEPRNAKLDAPSDKPLLRAVVLDFNTVNHIDVTAAQAIIDVRNQLAKYAAPEVVEWHFANIQSRWTKRALAAAGFGFRSDVGKDGDTPLEAIFSVADYADGEAPSVGAEKAVDIETGSIEGVSPDKKAVGTSVNYSQIPLHPVNRPFFHLDLDEAVEAAVSSAKAKNEGY